MADGSGTTFGSLVIGAAALAAVAAGTLLFGGGDAPPQPGPRSGATAWTADTSGGTAAGPVEPPAPATHGVHVPRTGFSPPGYTAGPVAPRTAAPPLGLVTTGTPKPVVIPKVEPGQEPVAVFDAVRHDFGVVAQGRNPVTTFRVRNTGKGPLQIVRIHSHCSCAPVMPGNRVIPPGGHGDIRVTFQTIALAGRVAKTIDVTTNDPKAPTTTLTVAAEVVRVYRFTPEAFVFGKVAPGSSASRTVEVTHGQGKPFRIVQAWGAPAGCRVSTKQAAEDGTRWQVTFELPRQTVAMTKAGRVQLRTEPATPAPLWIAYSFSVQPSIELNPWQVNWGTIAAEARPTATVAMRALGGAAFTITGVTVSPRNQLAVTTEATEDGWRIHVTPGKHWPKSGRVQASVRIATDHLQVPAVIPVYATVVPREK